MFSAVKQLKFEISIILCQYSYHSFLKGSKNKINLVKLIFPTAISSHQVLGTKGVGYVIDIPWIVLLYMYVEVIHELQIFVVVVVVVVVVVTTFVL